MAALFSGSKSGSVSLLLHIGSGSIGGLLVQNFEDRPPLILYTARESIVLRKRADHGKEYTMMKNSLDRVIERVLGGVGTKTIHISKLSSIVCILSSPWYVSQTKIISLEHKQPITISNDFIDTMTDKEIESFKKDINKNNSNGDEVNNNILIESHIIHIKLNGYPVKKPFGKKASIIEIAMIMSFAPQGIIKVVEEASKKLSHVGKVDFHTFSLAGFTVIRDIFPDIENFIFTEIGGEVTDVAIVKKGVLLETISLPLGSYTLVRSISESLNVLPDIALSYLSMDTDDAIHQELKANITSAKENARETWLKAFGNALSVLSEEIFLPRELFLISEQGTGDFFLALIKNSKFKNIAITGGSAHTTLLSGRTLSDFMVYEAGVPRDSFLSLITLFHKRVIL